MTDQQDAYADFFHTVGNAFITLAVATRPEAENATATAPDLAVLDLGSRQRDIAEVLQASGDKGLRPVEVSKTLDYDQANTHTVLRALETRGVVEEVHPDEGGPTRWRLAPHLRGTSDPYVRIAGLVREGEWTTYGDISVAVRGDTKAARAVGRSAAKLPHFPNPHRVLWSGGRIPPTWRSAANDAPDPEECKRRLLAEDVAFDEKGNASRSAYVSWDVLAERSEMEG